MKELKRIAAIHDISGFGKCSLTVALPVISASGVECACIPTALLSTHTGGFNGYTFKDLSDEMLPIARHWRSEEISFDGIYSGYLASAQQADMLCEIIDLLSSENTKTIVDPVMADNGKYYSKLGNEMCLAFRKLCSRAHIITPNITEAALLAELPYHDGPHDNKYIESLVDGLSGICSGIIAITGVRPDKENVGVFAVDTRTGEKVLSLSHTQDGIFCGTGDIFASAFSSLMIRGASLTDAAETAISLVSDSIKRTVIRNMPRRNGVDFEGALPSYIRRVYELFGE